jgi:hypothetical protein
MMRKNNVLLGWLVWITLILVVVWGQSFDLNAKNTRSTPLAISKTSPPKEYFQGQDRNLIKGVWGRVDAAGEIKITEVLHGGSLKSTFYNPKLIAIEKSIWTNSSGVLRVYILLREDDYPGSSFTLNYVAVRDVLVGVYYDALTQKSYPVTFERVN